MSYAFTRLTPSLDFRHVSNARKCPRRPVSCQHKSLCLSRAGIKKPSADISPRRRFDAPITLIKYEHDADILSNVTATSFTSRRDFAVKIIIYSNIFF